MAGNQELPHTVTASCTSSTISNICSVPEGCSFSSPFLTEKVYRKAQARGLKGGVKVMMMNTINTGMSSLTWFEDVIGMNGSYVS